MEYQPLQGKFIQAYFIVPGEPKGKGRPRFARAGAGVRTYTPTETASYENLVALEYERQNPGVRFPDDEQICIYITAHFGIPKSASKKQQAEMVNGKIRPTRKPDTDNILKIVCDALNGVAWRDDAQIVQAIVAKRYSYRPGVHVFIQPCGSYTEEKT